MAITLLVLPLAEVATAVGDASVADLLRENDDKLPAFFLKLLGHRAAVDVPAPHRQRTGRAEHLGVTRLLLAWAIGRDRSLRDTDARPDQAQAAGAVVGFVLAPAITLSFPATGHYPLLLLLLADPAVRAWRQARGGGKSPAHMGE